MPSPGAVYPLVVCWIEAVVGPSHPLAKRALAPLVTAVLLRAHFNTSRPPVRADCWQEPGNCRAAFVATSRQVLKRALSQRLTASGVTRTMLSDLTVPARQRSKRVARAVQRPWLAPAFLTPRLVRAALTPTVDRRPHLALDSVRWGGL